MFKPGTRFKVKIKIKLGEQTFEPGLMGTITGHVDKMIGKAYTVKFDDGRESVIHMVIINNQTDIAKDLKY